MPANDRLRPDEEEVATPVRTQPPDDQPEEPVAASDREPVLRPQRHVLALQQVLEDQVSTVPEAGGKQMEQKSESSVIGEA